MSSADARRTRRSPSAVRYLCSGTSMTFSLAGHAPSTSASVGLAGLALAELVLQRGQRAALLGEQQQARGFAVEAVHQFQEPRLGRAWRSCSITPKLTPLPPCTATPAGLSMASRCSSSNSTGIRAPAPPRRRRLGFGPLRTGGTRTVVARPHAGVGRGPALVDAHLAATDDAVDMGLGHALERAAGSCRAAGRPRFVHRRCCTWRRARRDRLHGWRGWTTPARARLREHPCDLCPL